MSFDDMKIWNIEKESICASIANKFCKLKILLKTRDDVEQLPGWIQHHLKITGPEGLIIFDNMSIDPIVERIYSEIDSRIQIFRFSEFHNVLHHTGLSPELYEALRQSCDHFIFLDTDERLSFYDGNARFISDETIIEFLSSNRRYAIFPGTWFQNVSGYTDRFSLYDKFEPFAIGLKWGKPIISSGANFSGMIQHNTQANHSLYDGGFITNFFVLHLSKLSKTQRISANIRKLRAYGALGREQGLEDLLLIPLDSLPPGKAQTYAREAIELLDPSKPDRGGLGGSIGVESDGTVVTTAHWQLEALEKFVTTPDDYSAKLFEQDS